MRSHTQKDGFLEFSPEAVFFLLIEKKETEFLEMGSYFDSAFIFFDRDIEVFLFLCLFY